MTNFVDFKTFYNMINTVCDEIFVENSEGIIEYQPESLDFYIRLVIEMNYHKEAYELLVKTAEDTGNELTFEDMYHFVYNDASTKLMNENAQVIALVKAINSKIDHKVRLLEKNDTENAFTTLINTITEKVNSIDTSAFEEKNVKSLLGLATKLDTVDISNTKEFADAVVSAVKVPTKRKSIKKTK